MLVPILPLSDSPPLLLPLKGTPLRNTSSCLHAKALSGIYIIYIYIPVETRGPESTKENRVEFLEVRSGRELQQTTHATGKSKESHQNLRWGEHTTQ